MTVLTACKMAAQLMSKGQSLPLSIFGSNVPFSVELQALSNEGATAIAKGNDWRAFTVLKQIVGDGVATAFDLPADYDRMPVKAELYSSRLFGALTPTQDLDVWLEEKLRGFNLTYGRWIMLGGQLQIMPAPAVGETVSFYYQSNAIVKPSTGANKALFDNDTDTFRLPERLLYLDLIWRWRQMKGLDYAESMRNFEVAKAEEMGREKGSRMLRVGMSRTNTGAVYAYPGTISAS